MYVIWNWLANDDDEDVNLFWSNENGWGDIKSATLFNEQDKLNLNLPQDGIWVDSPF